MNFTALLDVAIGLVLVYVGASLLVTMLNEWLTEYVFGASRRRYLRKTLAKLLDLSALERVAESNPRMKRLVTELRNVETSYVDTKLLAQSLMSALVPPKKEGGPVTPDEVRRAIEQLPESQIKDLLGTLAQVPEKLSEVVESIADWAERGLTTLGETYKRHMQLVNIGLGLLVAVGANIQTLDIVDRLYRDKELRDEMAVAAEQYVEQVTPDLLRDCPKSMAELSKESANGRKPRQLPAKCEPVKQLVGAMVARDATFGLLPVGWHEPTCENVGKALLTGKNWLGWVLTALALSLGAPFWFDLLNRLVNVRAAMKRPSESPKASAKTPAKAGDAE